jgi:hypothetical protein
MAVFGVDVTCQRCPLAGEMAGLGAGVLAGEADLLGKTGKLLLFRAARWA